MSPMVCPLAVAERLQASLRPSVPSLQLEPPARNIQGFGGKPWKVSLCSWAARPEPKASAARMIVLRLIAVLLLLVIAVSVALFLFTRDRRYLAWAWRTLQFALIVVIIVMVLYILERLVLI